MSEKKFDRILKEKLSNHDSRVPLDMWSKIEKDLGRRKSRPILPFALPIIALVGIVIYYSINFIQESPRSTDRQSLPTELKVNSQSDNSKLFNTDSEGIQNNNDIQAVQANINSGQAGTILSKKNPQYSNTDDAVNDADKSELNPQSGNSLNAEQENLKRSSSNTRPAAPTQSSKILNQNESSQSHPEYKSSIDIPIPDDANVKPRSADIYTAGNTPIIVLDENGSKANVDSGEIDNLNSDVKSDNKEFNTMGSEDQSSLEKLTESAEMKKSLIVERLPLGGDGQSLGMGHLVYDPCSVKGGKKKNRVHCYSFISQNSLVFADFIAGPQYSHKLLSARVIDGEEQNTLLNNRKDTETYMFSYNATARLGIKLPSGLTGTAGLSLDRFHERFDYYDPNQTRTTITHVIRDTFVLKDVNNMDSIVYEWETINIQTNGKHTVKHTNTLTFISIPLTAGYTWQMDKFNVGVNGGVSINLLFGKGGRIVEADGSVSSLNGSGSDDEFKAWAGLGLTGGLVFEYKLKNGLSFIAEPQFKYQLSNLTANGYGLEQRYVNAGINIGLRKILSERISHKKKYGVN